MDVSEKGSLVWTVTPDLLGILDASGVFAETNPAWFETLGWTADEIESRRFSDFLHPDDVAASEAGFDEIERGHNVLGFENRYRTADGSYRWLSWNVVPVGDRYICTARDITQRKDTEAALKSREEEAALREQFVAVLGHDLRNPLAALSSGMNILRRRVDDAETRDLMAEMGASVRRMAGLIDDVMDFARARLGGGLASGDKRASDLTPTLGATVQELRAAHAGVTILETYDFEEPVWCEARRVAQLLSNLLSNAITHGNPDQPIRVRAFDTAGAFVLTVANGGAAIPEAARPMLFAPFARSDLRHSQNGLGLGLFIASEIAKGHGGTLAFTSDGAATVFVFTMPRAQPPGG